MIFVYHWEWQNISPLYTEMRWHHDIDSLLSYNLQGTRKLVLPVHTPVEKKLFKELLENNPAFSSESGDPQWRLAVKIWNAEADARRDVFYKV
jgi:hypothetical protein